MNADWFQGVQEQVAKVSWFTTACQPRWGD